MTNDDLLRLDEAFMLAPEQFDALFDELLAMAPSHAQAVDVDGKGVYLTAQAGVELGEEEEALTVLGSLLHASGAGREMGALRRSQQLNPPASTSSQVPDEPWVRANEHASGNSAIEQAQACLLVVSVLHDAVKPWARMLVRERLAALLLNYPVLLHPRFVWYIHGALEEQLPMLHALAIVKAAALPTPILGLPERRTRAFACHPVLTYAASAPAPRLGPPDDERFLQGRTLAKQQASMSGVHYYFGHALLYINRVRAEDDAGAPLLVGTADGDAGIAKLITQNFDKCWLEPRVDAIRRQFLAELKASPTHPPRSFADNLLVSASDIFVDVATSGRAALVAAPDPLDRYERYMALLVETGVFSSVLDAARGVVGRLFRRDLKPNAFSAAPSFATVEVAYALIQRWQNQGIGFDELAAGRVRSGGQAWERVVGMLEAERRMNDHISAASTGEGLAQTPVVSRRQRGV